MSNTNKNERRLTGYRGDTTTQRNVQHDAYYELDSNQYTPNLSMSDEDDEDDIYDDYDQDYHEIDQDDDEPDDEQEEDEDDSGSELSIPDADIDFAMVYAFHTFAATVEGQASVVRGDPLTLLDDSNSYWWLVKVLNTSVVGYIPAENIETPYERLARLNSHRNVEITRKDIQDAFPIPPSTKPKQTKRVTLAKGVQFQSQIVYGSSDDEEDFETEFEQWNERMNSDESETDDQDSDDDPYEFYENSEHSYYTEEPLELTLSKTPSPIDYHENIPDEEPIDYYSPQLDQSDDDQNRESFNLGDETIKMSLTPIIARDSEENRHSDNSIQTKLKKAEVFEKLLADDEPQQHEKKEKHGIRKLFSRNSKNGESSERRGSNGSSYNESASMVSTRSERTSIDVQPSQIKVYAGNITEFGDALYKRASVYPSTTALELIHQLVELEQNDDQLIDDNAYHDYYLIVKTSSGEDHTLVPSDKPLEIFHSLIAHLSTPMPSLKKARRISQLMGSETNLIGEPSENRPVSFEEQVQFYLFSKTKRVDEGEIQIKVSLFSSESSRVDKLVKVSTTVVVKDAITLLLEKFHILNGISTGSDVKSLRLDGDDDVVKYGLILCNHGTEHVLNSDDILLDVLGKDAPPIQYRRHSNPDRTSISVNIPTPEQDELYFILKRTETMPVKEMLSDAEEHQHKPRRLVRQNTPMPRSTSLTRSPAAQMPQQTFDDDTLTPITPSPTQKRESVDSMLFVNDFGMNELMVMIRGAAQIQKRTSHVTIRNEISQVFQDSQARLDQLEKELDRIMFEAVKVHQ